MVDHLWLLVELTTVSGVALGHVPCRLLHVIPHPIVFLVGQLSELPLTASVRHVGFNVVLDRHHDFFNRIRFHVNDSFDLFLAKVQSKLLEDLDVEGVPVVGLLGDGVSRAVVVHVDQLRQVMLHDLCQEHSVRKVARDVSLRPRQWDFINPVVNGLKIVLRDIFLLLLLLLHV